MTILRRTDIIYLVDKETYRSGHNELDSKSSCRVTGTWVRIPSSPLYKLRLLPQGNSLFSFFNAEFFLFPVHYPPFRIFSGKFSTANHNTIPLFKCFIHIQAVDTRFVLQFTFIAEIVASSAPRFQAHKRCSRSCPDTKIRKSVT